MQFPIAVGTDRTDIWPIQKLLNLEDLKRTFSTFRSGVKDGPYIVPAVFEGDRRAGNVVVWSGAVLDLDAKAHANEQLVRETLKGLAYLAHTTWSHLEMPGVEHVRILVPYSQPVSPALHEKTARKLHSLFPGADECSTKSMQFFYLPTHRPGQENSAWSFNTLEEGELLDPANFNPAPITAPPPPPPNQTDNPGGLELWLTRLLEGEDLHGNSLALIMSMVGRGADKLTILNWFRGLRGKLEEVRGADRVKQLFSGELERMIDGALKKGGPPTNDLDFDQFVLSETADQMEAQMDADSHAIPRMAIVGQSTVFYGEPNVGKTLLLLHEICQQIEAGEIEGTSVYYVNADDHGRGIVDKQRLVEQFGFKMLVPGRNGLRAEMVAKILIKLARKGKARGCVVILDTLKKFTDLMSKKAGSQWGNVSREFVSAGGTLIALGHTNKHKDEDGNPIYAGTADVVEDSDCAYVMSLLEDKDDLRTVAFKNIKSRGDVERQRVFQYKTGQPYRDMFAGVTLVEEAAVAQIKQMNDVAARVDRHHNLIRHISELINDGVNTRTALIDAAKKHPEFSRNQVVKVLDEHAGDNFSLGHRWVVHIEEKNKHVYRLLSWGVKTCES